MIPKIMRLLLAAVFGAAFSFAAASETYIPVPSTNDISIGAGASGDFVFPAVSGGVQWIFIKNDCSTDLYFDLRGGKAIGNASFSLRLKSTEFFEAPMQIYTVTASNDGAAACTFTMQGGIRR